MMTFSPLGSVVSVASNGSTSPPLRDPWPPFRGPCAARADVRMITSAAAEWRDCTIRLPRTNQHCGPSGRACSVPPFRDTSVPHHATGVGRLDVVLSNRCIEVHMAVAVLSHPAQAEHAVRRGRSIPGGGFGNGGHLLRP